MTRGQTERAPDGAEPLPRYRGGSRRDERTRALGHAGLTHKARHRNITRVDDDTTRKHGWVVTVQRRGEIVVRTFSDGTHGDERKALAAAVAYRDLLHSQHSAFEHQVWASSRPRKNNRPGIPGVARHEVLANPRTGRRDAFRQASWVNERGLSRNRKFSLSRYGERQAKRLAIAERERQLLRVCAVKGDRQEARPGGWAKRLEGSLAPIAPGGARR